MLPPWALLLISAAYLGLLFAVAYYGDRCAARGRSIINNPYVYTLSLAVFCTAWTFYGSVGRAAESGLAFLPIYLGPTLIVCFWWFLLRKMVRITKAYGITSIADFTASRYGKSALLGGLVTVIAVVGIMPYISLQLKAVSASVDVLLDYPDLPDIGGATASVSLPFWLDIGFYVAITMAVFSILFGTRHIDATEHHQGMVAAIAFESIIKLIAFLIVGIFVTYGIYDGFGDIFDKATAAGHGELLTLEGTGLSTADWIASILVGAIGIMFLPRQFQVALVENVNEDHLSTAIWLFPLYLLLINLFVLPVALSGILHFPEGSVDRDTFVLTLPMVHGQYVIAIITYLGGLSAATAMVIVTTVALSTMFCNDLIMPLLLRMRFLKLNERSDLSGLLLFIRRGSIIGMMILGYTYFKLVGDSYALVTMGMVSFCAAAQFAPPILVGLYWKGATLLGAFTGLLAGFFVWLYTLLLPALARSGWIDDTFLTEGLYGIALLRPYELLGMSGLSPASHTLFWSLFVNLGLLVGVSLVSRQGSFERLQASLFVDVDRLAGGPHLWRGRAAVGDLRRLLSRYIGPDRAAAALAEHARSRGLLIHDETLADADFVNLAERLLAGAIGAASARVMISTVVKGGNFSPDEMLAILDEASQVIEYSRQLEQKSSALETATGELRRANKRLQELDRLKDDFISTVSHELRTPLTSIRSFSEILLDSPKLDPKERDQFLHIVVKESERLTRLINDMLDVSRIEAGHMDWRPSLHDVRDIVSEAMDVTRGLFREKKIKVFSSLADDLPFIKIDRDRMIQVVVNLLSNAAKFVEPERGEVKVLLRIVDGEIVLAVADNGQGIPRHQIKAIFEKFHQVDDTVYGKPKGSGLGLTICRHIVEHFEGRIWVRNRRGGGAVFRVALPLRLGLEEFDDQGLQSAAE